MKFTVKYFLDKAKHDLNYWQKKVKEIENKTFEYDGSMPKSCIDALCYHKVKNYENVIEYLEKLPEDLVIQSSFGQTKEGSEYYRLVNR